ncbi:MAG: hypothetical protein FDX21_05525 [Chlorobium sp.]|nr:MAG: hypothetical protein FDX21_05525 [Chlorobium sp.]
MNVQHILIDDNSAIHRELSICRTGAINQIRLEDASYKAYGTLEIDAHNYAAFFHYGLPELLNNLPFISESGNGLESWDEAFLHNSSLGSMKKIIDERMASIDPGHHETILLGWHDQPVGVAYFRDIEAGRFVEFLGTLRKFVEESSEEKYDLEFIL